MLCSQYINVVSLSKKVILYVTYKPWTDITVGITMRWIDAKFQLHDRLLVFHTLKNF